AGGFGVQVTAAVGDVVGLRGLVIDGVGSGGSGITFFSGPALHIQNCVIKNFEHAGFGYGILAESTTAHSQLFVSDTLVYNNGSSANTGGIVVELGSSSTMDVVLDRVHLENNVIGLYVWSAFTTGGAHVIVRDSVASGNAGAGIVARTVAGKGPAFLVIEHSTAVTNGAQGILADGPGATILLNDNTLAPNALAIS